MKSSSEIKFENVLKNSFRELLKPLGFKKKGNNFYSYKNGIGYIINVQKSSYYSKSHIHFTINTGIFLPEFWSAYYNHSKKRIPAFPSEPECILRKRIGELRKGNDKWYDIKKETDEEKLIKEMKKNLSEYILPHFHKVKSKKNIIELLNKESCESTPLEKLIVFGELGDKGKAKKEFGRLTKNKSVDPDFFEIIIGYGTKYGLKK